MSKRGAVNTVFTTVAGSIVWVSDTRIERVITTFLRTEVAQFAVDDRFGILPASVCYR